MMPHLLLEDHQTRKVHPYSLVIYAMLDDKYKTIYGLILTDGDKDSPDVTITNRNLYGL